MSRNNKRGLLAYTSRCVCAGQAKSRWMMPAVVLVPVHEARRLDAGPSTFCRTVLRELYRESCCYRFQSDPTSISPPCEAKPLAFIIPHWRATSFLVAATGRAMFPNSCAR